MAFKMKFAKEELKGMEPVPANIYDVILVGFKPKLAEKGDSINFNAQAKVVGIPELVNRMIFASLNTKIPTFTQDFVHSFGLEMEDQNSDNPSIPGIWDGDPSKFDEAKPETWVYKGPLIGQSAKWEVGVKPHYKDPTAQSQEIIRFICKVSQCAERFPQVRHAKDMRKKG